jgi:hypothetical protein
MPSDRFDTLRVKRTHGEMADDLSIVNPLDKSHISTLRTSDAPRLLHRF